MNPNQQMMPGQLNAKDANEIAADLRGAARHFRNIALKYEQIAALLEGDTKTSKTTLDLGPEVWRASKPDLPGTEPGDDDPAA